MGARDRELAWLEEAVIPGAVVSIVGPPGMGKAWLARAFVERMRGAPAGLAPEVAVEPEDVARVRRRLEAGERPTPGTAWLLASSAPVGVGPELVLSPLAEGDAARVFAQAAGLPWPDAESTGLRVARLLGAEPWALLAAAQVVKTAGLSALDKRLADPAKHFLGARDAAGTTMGAAVLACVSALDPGAYEVLRWAASAHGPVTFDVLEGAVDGSIETERVPDVLSAVLTLLGRGLLVRASRHGVVWFAPPWAVREVVRETDTSAHQRRKALRAAWSARARELLPLAYGPDAPRVLTELGAAALDAAAWLEEEASADSVALFLCLTDAIFFDGAHDHRTPAFPAAVRGADALGDPLLAARARCALSRARLEDGEAETALELAVAAQVALATPVPPGSGGSSAPLAVVRGECERRCGWALMALGRVEEATEAFAAARLLAEPATDLRGEADALAGSGMLALLSGDAAKADGLLRSSLAIHEVAQDAPRGAAVRGMMELLPTRGSPTDEEMAQRRRELHAEVAATRRSGNRVREALALARLALLLRTQGATEEAEKQVAEARVALRLLGVAVSPELAESAVTGHATHAYRLGAQAETLTLPDGSTHDLARHGALKRVLWALGVRHRAHHGEPLSVSDLVEAGWPGEKMKHEAATLRVYTTIRRLRKLGLESVLLTRDDGYLLDPTAEFVIEGGA